MVVEFFNDLGPSKMNDDFFSQQLFHRNYYSAVVCFDHTTGDVYFLNSPRYAIHLDMLPYCKVVFTVERRENIR